MSRYVINMVRSDGTSGDNKPKADAEQILEKRLGFQAVHIRQYQHSRIDQNLFIKSRINKNLNPLHLNADDVVLVHYPIYTGAKFETALLNYLKNRGTKTIVLIHDLDSLRFNWSIFGDLKHEVEYLNGYDYVIAHNPKMVELLRENGLTTNVVNLNIFDYLAKASSTSNSSDDKNLVTFAGNLNKAKFLKDLQVRKPVTFDLYGNIDNPKLINQSLDYHGSVSPEVLATKMGHGFGLVWDGDSVDSVTGRVGNYLKYNDPYKISSYLSSGMPVIVWKQSAISDFVISNQIGIAVDQIDDLQQSLNHISNADFAKMANNAQAIGAKLRNGDYLYTAVNKCLN
ncbi:galactofuranosyltransferase [Fructilactobacillus cliffordii]|uniref:Galactofuranosyltransferase n=1 Tax=Fructilactobacillus cliffordii TaxID=2940299 RepID=A0A9Q8ZWN6_9LACO|nr:galactofuranosyltransferase [Fructilactobacillus cliffordii]USS88921.1 galactofuranosyltransferase [Fructilactobacillus cliffordii]